MTEKNELPSAVQCQICNLFNNSWGPAYEESSGFSFRFFAIN